jgi:RNA polymerase sigma-70 factor (ECF subfamily)
LLDHYGPELLGYLTALLRDRRQARETYCLLADDLWKGLPGFQWRCTARAWAYALARHALARYVDGERRRLAAEQILRDLPWLEQLVERTENSTPLYLKSEVKSRLRALRQQLPEAEQTLIMLRIDRNLSWRELAIVLGEADADASDEQLARITARLRQRFQAVKDKLRRLAAAHGLLGRGEP